MTTLLTPISEQNVGQLSLNIDEDVEPDAQWKENLRARIEQTLQPMVDKAREDRDAQLRGLPEGSPQWEGIMKSYNLAMDRVRRLAQEQFTEELKIARFERSLALGKEVEGQEFEDFKRRQQAIWDTIKKGGAERQARRDSTVSNPTQESGEPAPRASGDPAAAPLRANGEQDAREGPSMPYREPRPLARASFGQDTRPRDRTQSGGSEQIPGTPGSYGASVRPARSRGNSSVFADFDPTVTSYPSPYDQGSIGRGGVSSLSKTRPQDIWLPPTPTKDDLPSTSASRTFAHAATPNMSPISPNTRETSTNDYGRTISRAASLRVSDRSIPDVDHTPFSRDRYGTPADNRNSKGKEPERPERARQPSFTQQTLVHDIYAPRPDIRMQMPATPARAPSSSQQPEEHQQAFAQVSPSNLHHRKSGLDGGEGIPIRTTRRSNTSEQGSPELMRYSGPQKPASSRSIPSSRRSLPNEMDGWSAQPSPPSHPYGPQSPPSVPIPSSSRPIPLPRPPSAEDDPPRRHSPSGAWHGSQSPPNVLPFSGYDLPYASSPRYRYGSSSPAASAVGRRNSNGSRSIRSRSSRQEFWGPSDVSQRPLATFEEQSVASDTESEEDYGVDLDDLWHLRQRAELRDRQQLTWKLVRDQEREEVQRKAAEAERLKEEARRKEEEAQRKEEEAKRKAEEARRKEEEVQVKALEIQQKAEELARREADIMRREMQATLQEEMRRRAAAEAALEQMKAAEARRKQEEAERLERETREREERERREKKEKEERERREREERERREKEERERREREERERREQERREKAELEKREREERELREKEERERKERERQEREERERQELEKAKREEERERREKERREREEWQRLHEEEFARQRELWEEARRRDAEAATAAAIQARLETERLQAEHLASLEAQREQEDAARREREAEAQRLQEEAQRREAEAQRQREQQQQAEAEAEAQRQLEEQQRRQREAAEEQRRRDAEITRAKEQEARRRKEAAARKQRETEERIMAEQRAAEAARQQREAEAARVRREAEDARQRQREAEAEAEAARARNLQVQPESDDELAQLEDPHFIREQEAEFARIRAQREREAATKQREEEDKRQEAAKKREEEEARRREAARRREEEDARKQAAFVREQEEAYRRAQAESEGRQRELEARRRAEDALRKKEEQQRQQSDAVLKEAMRRSEEEFRRHEERRHNSVGSGSDSGLNSGPHYGSSSSSSSAPRAIPTPGDRSSSASSSSFSSSASFFSAASGRSASTGYTSSSSRASATSTSGATPLGTPGTPSSRGAWKPPASPATPQPTATSTAGSRPSPSAYQTARGANSYAQSTQSTSRPSASFTPTSPLSEEEWARRQEEHARRQFEQFQREQEAQQRRSEQKAMRQLSKEEVIKLFDEHEKRWGRLLTLDMLSWHTFPWPMLKQPSEPEQLTYIEIQAYVLSPHQSADRTPRERIKDYLRKWHPDRFETKLLPKVREDEREKVKEGAGAVARHLNKLLGSLSSNAENGLFG